MILTLTPNPAHDITYAVESVTLGESHRVLEVHERAGGKGVNAASVLTAMGVPCVAVAPVGGPGSAAYAADLRARGVPAELIQSEVVTRRSVAVVDSAGEVTIFNEAGAPQPDAVWAEVSSAVARLAPGASVLTISGSLPPGTDPDLVLLLVREAQQHGLRVILDGTGEPLVRGLAAGPAIAKPNLTEASHAFAPGVDAMTAGEAALRLVGAGARAAIVSDGPRGLTLLAEGVRLHARLPIPLGGNPTGAGDALTASLAADLALVDDLPAGRDAWAEVLRRGVAWSAAAVLQPVAGAVDPGDVLRILPTVEIEEILE